jgi:hypothetical protein
MQTDTFTNLLTLVKGLSGNTSFTSAEETLVGSFINRRIYNAYKRSNYWPRYLVLGEARAATNSTIPFTQVTLNSIDSFLRIYDEEPWVTNSVDEYDFVVTADGAQILTNTSGASTFYVDYKKRWEGDYNSTTNQNVPLEFFHYGAHGAFADFLRYDGQLEKASAEEGYAESLLMLELENVMNQRNLNTAAKRIRSHTTQQARYTR